MDQSQIQLGYRMGVSAGGSASADIILCKYSAPTFVGENLPPFPSDALEQEIRGDDATVYDVVQSAPFSLNQEEEYENKGKVSGRERAYIAKRNGRVAFKISIEFEFDDNINQPFIFTANVSVTSLDLNTARDGFIVSIGIYETINSGDKLMEIPAPSIALHFAPTFLVAEMDYFTDRNEGLENMDREIAKVNHDYVRAKANLGPLDPVAQMRFEAEREKIALEGFQRAQVQISGFAESMTNRFAVPSIQQP